MNTRGKFRDVASVQQDPAEITVRLPGLKLLPPALRRQLRRQVLAVLTHDGPVPDYDTPAGDPGLFGPRSVTWKIHADFPSMMAGGMASLMVQMLHPLPLAAVWDHSNFRADILGRLRYTTAFVGRTTYASRAVAEAAIERVRRIHAAIAGTAADGRPYRADDPHLLTWIHSAECWCFLRAYQAYCHARVPLAMQDRYLTEMATIAEALGAQGVPKSMRELEAYFASMRAELVFDDRTREVLRVVGAMRLPIPLAGFSRNVFLGAAAALLPEWTLAMIGRSSLERVRDRAAAQSLKLVAPSIRDALAVGGLGWRACARTGTDYADLFRWPAR